MYVCNIGSVRWYCGVYITHCLNQSGITLGPDHVYSLKRLREGISLIAYT